MNVTWAHPPLFLGTPIQLLVNINGDFANQINSCLVVYLDMVKTACWTSNQASDRWLEWLFVADSLVCVQVFQLLIWWDFHLNHRVYREWSEEEKITIEKKMT